MSYPTGEPGKPIEVEHVVSALARTSVERFRYCDAQDAAERDRDEWRLLALARGDTIGKVYHLRDEALDALRRANERIAKLERKLAKAKARAPE